MDGRKEGTAVHFGAFWDLAKIAWPRNRYLDADFGSGLPSEQTGSSIASLAPLQGLSFHFPEGKKERTTDGGDSSAVRLRFRAR